MGRVNNHGSGQFFYCVSAKGTSMFCETAAVITWTDRYVIILDYAKMVIFRVFLVVGWSNIIFSWKYFTTIIFHLFHMICPNARVIWQKSCFLKHPKQTHQINRVLSFILINLDWFPNFACISKRVWGRRREGKTNSNEYGQLDETQIGYTDKKFFREIIICWLR